MYTLIRFNPLLVEASSIYCFSRLDVKFIIRISRENHCTQWLQELDSSYVYAPFPSSARAHKFVLHCYYTDLQASSRICGQCSTLHLIVPSSARSSPSFPSLALFEEVGHEDGLIVARNCMGSLSKFAEMFRVSTATLYGL
jgi:hypothetical protein